MERSLDNMSKCTISQQDVEKYYDSLPILRIADWMISGGANPQHVACMHLRQVSVDLVFFVISSLLAGLAACA